jgi:hypothetical protein
LERWTTRRKTAHGLATPAEIVFVEAFGKDLP